MSRPTRAGVEEALLLFDNPDGSETWDADRRMGQALAVLAAAARAWLGPDYLPSDEAVKAALRQWNASRRSTDNDFLCMRDAIAAALEAGVLEKP